MPISPTELRLKLSNDEPDYAQLAQQMAGESAELLTPLTNDPDPMLASKAVYLASLLPDPQAHRLVEAAADSGRPLVKIAAASALPNLPTDLRNALTDKLIDADDISVQKLAIRAVDRSAPDPLKAKVERISTQATSERIRNLSRETFNRIK